jgi:hypothetical protein
MARSTLEADVMDAIVQAAVSSVPEGMRAADDALVMPDDYKNASFTESIAAIHTAMSEQRQMLADPAAIDRALAWYSGWLLEDVKINGASFRSVNQEG